MPHRRKPSGVARNFIQGSAFFDCKAKESINQVSAAGVLCAVAEAFPEASEDALAVQVFGDLELAPDALVDGLVLSDPRGEGALR
jgi:hypothetical protein